MAMAAGSSGCSWLAIAAVLGLQLTLHTRGVLAQPLPVACQGPAFGWPCVCTPAVGTPPNLDPHACKHIPFGSVKPPTISSQHGVLNFTLVLKAMHYNGYPARFNTRGYAVRGVAGIDPNKVFFPGPTLVVRRGDRLRILMKNELGPNDVDDPGEENEYRHPNTTNLHTHGFHESPRDPADNVLLDIAPGQSHQYEYTIPADHAPGTMWYHPHSHGSSALQVGAGAAGAIIILDEINEMPPAYYIPPLLQGDVMVLQNLFMAPEDPSGIVQISEKSKDHLLAPSYERTDAPGTTNMNEDWWLVNGLYQPVISLTAGRARRWRMIGAGVDTTLHLAVDSAACVLRVLAKDGITLSPAPRPAMAGIYLAPGNRVDVLVTCPPGEYNLIAMNPNAGGRAGTSTRAHSGEGSGPGSQWVGTIMHIHVGSHAGAPPPLLPTFFPPRPNYLADLSSAAVPNKFTMTPWNVSLAGRTINGEAYQHGEYIHTMELGTVQEWGVSGNTAHPFHLHVWPFQIVELNNADQDANAFYKVGDWHDTLMMLDPAMGSQLTVRFQAARFGGDVVIHCHIFAHEDVGMMAVLKAQGDEGASPPVTSTQTQCKMAVPDLEADPEAPPVPGPVCPPSPPPIA